MEKRLRVFRAHSRIFLWRFEVIDLLNRCVRYLTKNLYVIRGRGGGGVLGENIQYSDYFADLEGPAKSRYQEKITVCGFDPYALRKSDFSENIELLPNVQYPDIVNYLVLQTSWATQTQMKAYKSMDAYNFFVSGWVNTLCKRSVDTDKVVVFARVSNVIFLPDNL